jgi:copper chaperone CopZ
MKKLLILGMALGLLACSGQGNKQATDAEEAVTHQAEWTVVTLHVEGMTCEGCENAIKAGVESLEGIQEVESSHEEAFTRVKFDKSVTSLEEITGKITETGYEVLGEKTGDAS